MNKKDIKNYFKKFWDYVWHDNSIGSYILNFILAFIIIKYIFFPGLGLLLHNDYPIVAIVSGSMEHKITEDSKTGTYSICNKHFMDVSKTQRLEIESWWQYCGNYYKENFNLSLNNFKDFKYKNGLNIGDVMILYKEKPENIQVGEVLVFIPDDKQFFEQKGPVIHRVVEKYKDKNENYHFRTKGDHNPKSYQNFEDDITEDEIIATAVFRIPFIGYPKKILNDIIVMLVY